MLYTTLALCKKHHACKHGYSKLIKSLPENYKEDDLISLLHIVHSNGVEDAVWALRATTTNSDKFARVFACKCAEHVLPLFESKYPNDRRPRQAIEVSRRFAQGKVSWEELREARSVARDVAQDTEGSVARDVAQDAARTAWHTTRTVAWDAAQAAQYIAWCAAQDAARTASEATQTVERDSARTAQEAARDTELAWQTNKFLEMLEGFEKL